MIISTDPKNHLTKFNIHDIKTSSKLTGEVPQHDKEYLQKS